MIYLETNEVVDEFFNHLGLNLEPDKELAIKNFVTGLIGNEQGTINHIASNTIASLNERQMNRKIHELSKQSDCILEKAL